METEIGTNLTRTPKLFGFSRVGIVSPECRVANPDYNVSRINEAFSELHMEGCLVALSPEMGVCGYTIGDLVYQDLLLEAVLSSLAKLVFSSTGVHMLCVVGAPLRVLGRIYNCAVVYSQGRVLGVIPKTYLPNTGEYYEKRTYASGRGVTGQTIELFGERVPFGTDVLFRAEEWPDLQIGVEICEDLWAVEPPSSRQALAGATLLLNLSASNEVLGKAEYRRALICQQSARCLAAYAYVSSGLGESTTDMVFGGYGAVVENGAILGELDRFGYGTSALAVDVDIEKVLHERSHSTSFMDLGAPSMRTIPFRIDPVSKPRPLAGRIVGKFPFIPSDASRRDQHCEEIFEIQVRALLTRLKYSRAERVVIGVSGGLDSALALLVAVRTFDLLALPRSNVIAVTMPSFGTTNRTRDNASRLCRMLSVDFRTIDITTSVLQHFSDIGHSIDKHDIVFENSQARERTQVLMDLANKESALVLGTGDLSEAALGWCTFNGDHMSSYHVNSGVPKTLVQYIVRWCSNTCFVGPTSEVLEDICDTPISPELLPLNAEGDVVQRTEDSIGPYVLHDFFLYYAIRHHFSPLKVLYLAEQAFEGEFEPDAIRGWLRVFYQRFFTSQFKRSSVPDGPKVGSVALSPRADWRMPSDAEVSAWLSTLDAVEGSSK